MPRFSDVGEAEKDLRISVITGEVRARFQGETVGPEVRGQIARTYPEALPQDIEISIEDAERVYSRHLEH